MSTAAASRPQPPEKPLPSDCCGSGCVPCVLDTYEEALEQYQEALEHWLGDHPDAATQAPSRPSAGTPRLVLDTNVLLDLYVFRDPNWSVLLDALKSGACEAVTRVDCREEFLRVLRYPMFELSVSQRLRSIEDHDALHRCVMTVETDEDLPHCRDPDDQKFLELALQAEADMLLSKDKALLKLARRLRRMEASFAIMSPLDWVAANAPA